jgi:hypothetical protein
LVGITLGPAETESVVKIVDVEDDAGNAVVVSVVMDAPIVTFDCELSLESIVTVNDSTNVGISGVVGDHHLTNVAAELLC